VRRLQGPKQHRVMVWAPGMEEVVQGEVVVWAPGMEEVVHGEVVVAGRMRMTPAMRMAFALQLQDHHHHPHHRLHVAASASPQKDHPRLATVLLSMMVMAGMTMRMAVTADLWQAVTADLWQRENMRGGRLCRLKLWADGCVG